MDVVVTVPKSFGLGHWIAEGDAAGEQPEVLDYLRAEHEWAMERMIAAGITPPGHTPVTPKGQMEMFV